MNLLFKQHKANTSISSIYRLPKIKIDLKAFMKMQYYVENVSDEVGWLGTATLRDSDIVVTDTYLFKQEVHSTTCEITSQGLTDFAMELCQQEDGMDIFNNIRLWGHSHVNMEVSPSGQDNQQMVFFKDSGQPWFLRVIANKKGDMKFTLYDYNTGIVYYDLEWELDMDIDTGLENNVKEEIKEKVKKFTYQKETKKEKDKDKTPIPRHRYDYEDRYWEDYNEEFYRKDTPSSDKKEAKEEVQTKEEIDDEIGMALYTYFAEEDLLEMSFLSSPLSVYEFVKECSLNDVFDYYHCIEIFEWLEQHQADLFVEVEDIYGTLEKWEETRNKKIR